MTVGLAGKGVVQKVTRNVRNISNLSSAELEGDIEYVLFSEHELPMEDYLKFQPVVKDLAKLIVTHADAAVRRKMLDMKYDIASRLRDEVAKIVMEGIDETKEEVEVNTASDLGSLMNG